MALKRRSFLQQSGMALAALGISEGLSFTSRYSQALAQPARRKLALLVGIDQYPEAVCDFSVQRGSALNGCVTDVALQRELLIHRFGFAPDDILSLTNQAATRQQIETAFIEHLIQQATSGDLVLFHFSGLGSQVQVEQASIKIQTSLVPIDGVLPTADDPFIHDLMLDTLGLLLRSLETQQVITVIDAGFTKLGRPLQGSLRVRSRPDVPTGLIDSAEQEFQQQLMQQTHLTLDQINQQWQLGQLPGIVLQASTINRVATESQWNGFSAGLFTYALTQQLWWSAPMATLWIGFNQALGTVKQSAGIEQQPTISGESAQKQILPLAINLTDTKADGVIQAIEEDGRIRLWVGGLPAIVLENAGASLFAISGSNQPILQLRSREGLVVKARDISKPGASLQPGQLVQERVRVLSRNVGLTVAIDNSLERIERVDATSAFAAIPHVSSVIAGEQPADFLFGKTQPAPLIAASSAPLAVVKDTATPEEPNAQAGYGLFYPGRDAIPSTLIQSAEAVKTAVNRMTPQLKTLLAIKLLRLIQNQGSSQLGIRAALAMTAPQERLILQQETLRAPRTQPTSKVASLLMAEGFPLLPTASQIQYRLFNYSSQPLYFILLSLDTQGNPFVFYPGGASASSSPIEPGETVAVPSTTATAWRIQPPIGLAETHLVFSHEPLVQTYQSLELDFGTQPDARQMMPLSNPLDVVQAILQDLHQASSAILPDMEISTDSYALDVQAWATLSFVYQVT